eukprot:TRINITY_DN342_c0_g1_i1.p1 TRINITY_DN342_c0_g1~~TRINITY_DN342_c0_g1_i1.p1  ORF type:complete len:119 (-),score=20.19 TRINITY_DN342_c0_g1_i1:28-351(-)
MAYKPLNITMDDAIKLTRDEIEVDMKGVGFILFRNQLKPDTAEALTLLRKGNVRNVMITGDNIQTGCYIAKQSGMIDPMKYVLQTVVDKGTILWKQSGNDCAEWPLV